MAVYGPDQDRIRCGDHYLDPEVAVELHAVGNSDRPRHVTRVHWGQSPSYAARNAATKPTQETSQSEPNNPRRPK